MMHGDIRVNGDAIATWTATRLVHPPQARNDYEVSVTYKDPGGTVHSARGVISHQYGDGSLLLLGEVMAWAHEQVHDLYDAETTDTGVLGGREAGHG